MSPRSDGIGIGDAVMATLSAPAAPRRAPFQLENDDHLTSVASLGLHTAEAESLQVVELWASEPQVFRRVPVTRVKAGMINGQCAHNLCAIITSVTSGIPKRLREMALRLSRRGSSETWQTTFRSMLAVNSPGSYNKAASAGSGA